MLSFGLFMPQRDSSKNIYFTFTFLKQVQGKEVGAFSTVISHCTAPCRLYKTSRCYQQLQCLHESMKLRDSTHSLTYFDVASGIVCVLSSHLSLLHADVVFISAVLTVMPKCSLKAKSRRI